MRNRFPGPCYRCGETVEAGAGHFERIGRGWRVQHAGCAIQFRGVRDDVRQRECERQRAIRLRLLHERAKGTGKASQRARSELRRLGLPPSEQLPSASGTEAPTHEAGRHPREEMPCSK